MATVAAFIALGGTSLAATGVIITDSSQIKNGGVSGADVKDSSVTGSDIKDRSLSASDFNGAVTGPQGAKGDTGAAGPQGAKGEPGEAGARRQGRHRSGGTAGCQWSRAEKKELAAPRATPERRDRRAPRASRAKLGLTGPGGAQGLRGDSGSAVPAGPVGPKGEPGTGLSHTTLRPRGCDADRGSERPEGGRAVHDGRQCTRVRDAPYVRP